VGKTTTYHPGRPCERTNGHFKDHSQWEVRRNIYEGTVKVLHQEEVTILSLAMMCFLSFRQQTQGFHTFLRDKLSCIVILQWQSLFALLLYESVLACSFLGQDTG
jgi:hypothetical protein